MTELETILPPDPEVRDLNENLAIQEKATEDNDNVSQVSPNILSFTQLYSIETIKNKLDNETLSVPVFQRKAGLWSLKNQSLFIESILLQLPIPSIVVFADKTNKLKVIDGLQRITTLKSFLNNELTLVGLEQIKTERLNSLCFSQLGEDERNAFLNSTISIITVQCSPEDIRSDATYYEIFRRLNQGGLPLTPQEIRNALYRGKFLTFLKGDETVTGIRDSEIWKNLYAVRGNQNHNYARERDVELLLKIFAIAETEDENIKKNLGDFLNTYIENANNKSNDQIEKMRISFNKSLEYIENNNIIIVFRGNKIIGTIWYNMLLATLVKHFLNNPANILVGKNFQLLIDRKDSFPNASSDTWNIGKIKEWRRIFEEFILAK